MVVETTHDRLEAAPQLNLAELFPAWQRRAACLGVGNGDFFQRNHGTAAKEICATCPVVVECLVEALKNNEEDGIWGGCGEARRRGLRQGYLKRSHEDAVPRANCRCSWCVGVRRHLVQLAAYRLPAGERHAALRARPPLNVNGPRARHGRRSTYTKGCRCDACTWSASAWGLVVSWLGLDSGDMWAECVAEAEAEAEKRTPRAVAEERVELLVSELVAALCSLAACDAAETRRLVAEGLEHRRLVREGKLKPAA